MEAQGTEEELVKELTPEFGQDDAEFVVKTSAEMYHVLLNITTGEGNAVVRRSLAPGWLAWKRLTSSLNPRTLGIESAEDYDGVEGRGRGGRVGGQAREPPDRVRPRTGEQNEGGRVVRHDAKRLSGKGSG